MASIVVAAQLPLCVFQWRVVILRQQVNRRPVCTVDITYCCLAFETSKHLIEAIVKGEKNKIHIAKENHAP